MASFPIMITRSIRVLDTRLPKSNELVSCAFFAKFADGSEKILNDTRWQMRGLLKESDLGDVVMDPASFVLYHRDWSAMPGLAKVADHYPAIV